MPTWEQHQRALGRAREAGDTEAVAEIEANIAGEAAASGAQEQQPSYDKSRFQKALKRASEAQDHEAMEEIAVDWMSAADAAGKRSPAQYDDDELTSTFDKAVKSGDMEGVILTGVEMKRRKANQDPIGDIVSGITNLPGQAVGAVMGGIDAVGQGISTTGEGMRRLASGEASMEDLGGAIVDNVVTGARSIPGADLLYAGGGNIVNALEGDDIDPNLVQKTRDVTASMAQRNPAAALAGELMGAGAVANRVLKVPGLAVKAGQSGNIARTALAGGATEGAVALADTLDPKQAAERAVTGAVVAPIVGAVAKKVIDIAAPTARMVVGKPAPAGMTKLAQLLKIPVAELEAARVSLKNARGSNPSIAEIVDTATIQRTQAVVGSQPVVAKAAEDAATAGEVARPSRLAGIVEVGGPTRSGASVAAERSAVAQENLDALGEARRQAGQQATARTRQTVQAERLAAETEARGIEKAAEEAATGAADTARAQTKSRIAEQTAEARRVIETQRKAAARDVNTIRQTGQQAVEKMRAEMRKAADAGGLNGPERATAMRDEWATAAMKQMDSAPVVLDSAVATKVLGGPAIRNMLTGAARVARSDARQRFLLGIIDDVDNNRPVRLSVRDIDNLRQELRAAGDKSGFKAELNAAADELIEASRVADPRYRAFLELYGDLSDEIAGSSRGAKFVGGGENFSQEVADAGDRTRAGMDRGARLEVESTAGRSTQDAEKLARELATEGGARNAQAVMGGRGASMVDSARRGVAALDEAADLAKSRVLQGKNSVAEAKEALQAQINEAKANLNETIRSVGRELKTKRGQAADRRKAGADRIAVAREKLSDVRSRLTEITQRKTTEISRGLGAEKAAVRAAGDIKGGETSVFKEAFGSAPDTVRSDLPAVARAALADDLKNSFGRSVSAAEDLQGPGFQERARTAFGDAEAARLAKAGKQEASAGRNLDALNPAPNPKATQPGGDANLALNTMGALGPAGAGYKVNVIGDILKKFKRLGMSDKAAKGLSEALFDPAKSEEAVRVLKQIKQWDDVSAMLAQKAAATQAGTEGNQ